MDSNIEWAQGKAKDGNFYLCSKWDSNFLAKCLVKSHDVNHSITLYQFYFLFESRQNLDSNIEWAQGEG